MTNLYKIFLDQLKPPFLGLHLQHPFWVPKTDLWKDDKFVQNIFGSVETTIIGAALVTSLLGAQNRSLEGCNTIRA